MRKFIIRSRQLWFTLWPSPRFTDCFVNFNFRWMQEDVWRTITPRRVKPRWIIDIYGYRILTSLYYFIPRLFFYLGYFNPVNVLFHNSISSFRGDITDILANTKSPLAMFPCPYIVEGCHQTHNRGWTAQGVFWRLLFLIKWMSNCRRCVTRRCTSSKPFWASFFPLFYVLVHRCTHRGSVYACMRWATWG